MIPNGQRDRLGQREHIEDTIAVEDADTEARECYSCGDRRPPDGTGAVIDGAWRPLCPPCEDMIDAAHHDPHPPGSRMPPVDETPPHGNTTR